MSCSPTSTVYGYHSGITALRCSGHETLPFTGFNLAGLLFVAVGLVVLGLTMRSLLRLPKRGA